MRLVRPCVLYAFEAGKHAQWFLFVCLFVVVFVGFFFVCLFVCFLLLFFFLGGGVGFGFVLFF